MKAATASKAGVQDNATEFRAWRSTSTAGTENVFIVFSRQPEPDLEKLMYSLKGGDKRAAKPEEPITPGALSRMDKTLVMASTSLTR